jgi:hypothetical protein
MAQGWGGYNSTGHKDIPDDEAPQPTPTVS